jgi:hypothetical protein
MKCLSDDDRLLFGFDETFEDRWWRLEKITWIAMLLFAMAAASGAYGGGPISQAHRSAGDVVVEYDRVVRYQAPTRISLMVPASVTGSRVHIGRSLLDRLQLESVVPRPLGAEPRDDGAVLLFPPHARSGRITLVEQPATLGVADHQVGLDGRTPVVFRQIVLP